MKEMSFKSGVKGNCRDLRSVPSLVFYSDLISVRNSNGSHLTAARNTELGLV